MLIVSKFTDYYDGVVGATGVDKSIVYERKQTTPSRKEYYHLLPTAPRGRYFKMGLFDRSSYTEFLPFPTDIQYFIIGFCGKLYTGAEVTVTDHKTMFSNKVYYGGDLHIMLNEYIEGYKQKPQAFEYGASKKSVIQSFDRSRMAIESFINDYHEKDYNLVFREFNTPIFVWEYSRSYNPKEKALIINPILKDYEFYKVKDTYTTFQEIQMYVSGVLGVGEPSMIEVSEKHKLEQHGMDEWSFRNPDPPKRKQK